MPAPELAEAIRLVHRGYSQMAPGLMERLLTRVADSDDVKAQPAPEELAIYATLISLSVSQDVFQMFPRRGISTIRTVKHSA